MRFTQIPAHLKKFILTLLLCVMAVIPAFSQKPESTPQGTPLKKCWTSPIDQAAVRKLYSDAATIYAAMSDGKLQAFQAQDGTTAWTVEIGGEFVSNMLAANDHLIIVSNTSGEKKQSTIRSISKQTGVVHWRAEVPFSDKYFLGGATPTELAAVGSTGFVIGISLENGAANWKADIAEASAEPSFGNGTVLVGTASKRIYSVSQTERGRIVLNIETKWKPTAVALLGEGKFVAGDERGNIVAYHSNGSTDWRFKNGASISHLTPTTDGILAASNDNFLYLLTENRGGVIWKRRLSGRIALEPVVMKESVFAVTYGDGRGYLISMNKGKITDQTETAEKDFTPISIAGSADGHIAVPTPSGIVLYSPNTCP